MVLIDWLIDVHFKFELKQETLFLTINIIDRYLSLTCISRKKLQLVGVTALLIASKFEDVYAPETKDISKITAKTYSVEDIISMEAKILIKLDFNMIVTTPLCFLERFRKCFN